MLHQLQRVVDVKAGRNSQGKKGEQCSRQRGSIIVLVEDTNKLSGEASIRFTLRRFALPKASMVTGP